jgi:membrane protease YdiL (CAAX protease family)
VRNRSALTTFVALCAICEIALLVFDRKMGYLAAGAAAYNGLLWLATAKTIRVDIGAEERTLKTFATGGRLAARVFVVALICAIVVFGRERLWFSPWNAAIQHVWSSFGLGIGDSAPFNFLLLAVVPGALLFALGATRAELGLTRWRAGSVRVLLWALVLPTIFATMWFAHGRGSVPLLLVLLLHNLLSNGFSEEFFVRGMVFSHLRAFVSKEWALALQAVAFGLMHVDPSVRPDNWYLEVARNIVLNAPTGYFWGLIALRSRGVFLTSAIHALGDASISFLG